MIQFSYFTDLHELRREIARENGFIEAAEGYIRTQVAVDGYCHLCEHRASFTVNGGPDFGPGHPNLREGLVCPCGGKNRDRLMMLASRDRLATAKDIVFFGALSGWARWARKAHGDRILFCEYFGDRVAPGESVPVEDLTVRNEDMTRMTLADASTDLILHQDVLEHIPDYRAALSDTLRVLRPGATTIFTAPFFHLLDQTFVRASLDEAGTVVHHAEPELHGDPLVPEGILAFYNFGWSLIDDMREVGFEDVRLTLCYRPDLGIVSTGCPLPEWNMMPVYLTGSKPIR